METKTFDCVEMKHNAQEALLAEFNRRRDEFATLPEFLDAKAKQSEWVSSMLSRFGGKKP